MKENLKGLITFDQFEEIYLKFYYSEEYSEIINKGLYYKNAINTINKASDYQSHVIYLLKPKEKINFLRNRLINDKSKNHTNFYKTLIIINTLFDNEALENLLMRYHIDVNILTYSINNAINMKKILGDEKSHEIISDEDITRILKPINDYYGYNNNSLYIFKIYELMVLKKLQKEPAKKTK